MKDTSSIRFYWSFRSPYAWLAAERVEEEIGALGVPIESVPIFPTPDQFPNDPSALRSKGRYLVQDVLRLARERGLTVKFPSATDPDDWALSHAAFLGAEEAGAGHAFMVRVFRKRWMEGRDLGDEAALAEAAEEAGLQPHVVLDAAHSAPLRARVKQGWGLAAERDGIFGVPSFVFAGKLYWGQDRMHFLRSAVERKAGAAA